MSTLEQAPAPTNDSRESRRVQDIDKAHHMAWASDEYRTREAEARSAQRIIEDVSGNLTETDRVIRGAHDKFNDSWRAHPELSPEEQQSLRTRSKIEDTIASTAAHALGLRIGEFGDLIVQKPVAEEDARRHIAKRIRVMDAAAEKAEKNAARDYDKGQAHKTRQNRRDERLHRDNW